MKGRVTKTGYRDDSPDRFNDYNVVLSDTISMNNVSNPIMIFPIKNNKVSNPVQGIPGEEYYFPGADGVVEMPLPPGRMSYERKAKGGSTEAKMREVLSKVAYGKGGSTMTSELAAKILKTGSIYGKTLTASQKNKFADLAAQIGIDENGDPIEEEKDNSSDVEEYKRGGSSPKAKKKGSKTTSKNVYTAINGLFARNTMLYGSGGKEFYQPQMKQGGWLDQYQTKGEVTSGDKEGTEQNPVDLPEVKTTPWTGSILNYEDANPKERYINDLKQAYLNNTNTKGLNKLAGLSMENFPGNVEQEYANEYLYKRNNSIAPKIIDSYSKSGDRTEWVDKLTEEEKDIITNSDYRFLLEPNSFDTSYAGAAKLLNAIGMPIEEGDAKSLGITKKEDKNIGKLNLLDFLNVPGQALGSGLRSPNLPGNPNNAYMNNSMMKGLQGYHDPKRLAGEEFLANPLNWTLGYDAPALGYGIGKGINSLANFSDAFTPNLSGIGDDLLGRSRVDSPMPGIKSQLAKSVSPASVGTSNYLPPIPEELYIDLNAPTFGSYPKLDPNDLPPPPGRDPFSMPPPPPGRDPYGLFNPFLEENLAELNQTTPSILTSATGNLKGALTKTGSKLKTGMMLADDFIKRKYGRAKEIIKNPIIALDPYAAGSLKNQSVLEQTFQAQESLSDLDKAFLGLPNKNSKLSVAERIVAKDRFDEDISDNAYKYWGSKIYPGLNISVNPKEIRAAHREASEFFKNYPHADQYLIGLYMRDKLAEKMLTFKTPRFYNKQGEFLALDGHNKYDFLKEAIPARTFTEAVRRNFGKEPKFLSAKQLQKRISSGKFEPKQSNQYNPNFHGADADYHKNRDINFAELTSNPNTPKEENLLQAYAHGYDDYMNRVARGMQGDVGKALRDPEYAKVLQQDLQAAMGKSNQDAYYLQKGEELNKAIQKNKIDSDKFEYVRRGSGDHEVELVDPETLMLTGEKKMKSEMKEGEAFLDRGFVSTTTHSGVEDAVGNQIPFMNHPGSRPETSELIVVPKGKKLSGSMPNVNTGTEYRNEGEILLPKNLIRRIVKINDPSHRTRLVTEILNPYKKGGSTGWLDELPKAQDGLNNTQKPVVDVITPEDLVNMKTLGYPIYRGQDEFYNKFKDAKTFVKTEANPKGENLSFFNKGNDEYDPTPTFESYEWAGYDKDRNDRLKYNFQESVFSKDPNNPVCKNEQCTARANRAIGSMYLQTGDSFYQNPDVTKQDMGVTYTTADAPTPQQQQQYDYMMGDTEFGSLDAWDVVQQAKKKIPKNVLYSAIVDVPKEVGEDYNKRREYEKKYEKTALKTKDIWKKYDIPVGSYINVGESNSSNRKDIVAGSHTLRVVGYTDEGEPLVADYGYIVPLSKSMYSDHEGHDFVAGIVTVPGKEKYTYKFFKEQARLANKPNTTPYVKDIKSENYGDRYKTFHDNIVKEKNYIAAKLGVDSQTYDQYAKIALTLGGVETDFGKGKVFNLPFLDSMGESIGVAQVTEANVANKYKSTLSKYKDDPEAYNAMSALLYVKELDNYKDKWLKSGEKAGERPFNRTDESSVKNIVREVQGRKQQGYINSDMPLPGAPGKSGQDVFRYTDANDKPREIKLPYKQFWQSDADYEKEVNEVLSKEDPTLRFSDKGDKGGRTIYKKTKGNTIPKTLEDFVYYAWQAPNAVAYGDAQGTSTYYKKAKAIQAKLFGEKLAQKKLGGASAWLDKYQTKGQVNPIYVTDPNDYRLRAYNDSLWKYRNNLNPLPKPRPVNYSGDVDPSYQSTLLPFASYHSVIGKGKDVKPTFYTDKFPNVNRGDDEEIDNNTDSPYDDGSIPYNEPSFITRLDRQYPRVFRNPFGKDIGNHGFKNEKDDRWDFFAAARYTKPKQPILLKPDPNRKEPQSKAKPKPKPKPVEKKEPIKPELMESIDIPILLEKEKEREIKPSLKAIPQGYRRIGWREDPNTKLEVPVLLTNPKMKVKDGRRIYNEDVPSSTSAIPDSWEPEFNKKEQYDKYDPYWVKKYVQPKKVASKKQGGWLDDYK